MTQQPVYLAILTWDDAGEQVERVQIEASRTSVDDAGRVRTHKTIKAEYFRPAGLWQADDDEVDAFLTRHGWARFTPYNHHARTKRPRTCAVEKIQEPTIPEPTATRLPTIAQPTAVHTSTERDSAGAGGDDVTVKSDLYDHLARVQRNLDRAEARAESLRAERVAVARYLIEEGESIAAVAAKVGLTRQRLHKLLQETPPESTGTDPMF